jgi:methyl-accepting chemotaxis protein
MAVIEFDLDGRVLDANPQFLSAMGYRIEEIRGKHHRQFVLPGEAESAAYAEFWKRLAQGSVESGRYRRRAKDGSEIWLQASYNPVLDAAGRPYKVVKFATNITPALRSMMSEIAELAEQIKSASGEIAAGNGDLASRTEAQAASIEETAASMEQLIGTVRQTAANADQARRLAGDATEAAGRGSGVVRSVVDSMHEIDGASRRIADIIGLIDGIAFQTNILALNAAVEAARAGEQGRGFAVVASEVRALAQRSAEAAKDIKGLIGDSSRSVKEGTHRAETAGTAMQAILDSVDKVGGLLSEVASATAEQTSGIEQVNQAIAHIDEGTQQNAALVEQASAASRLLDEQARALNQTVAHFLA